MGHSHMYRPGLSKITPPPQFIVCSPLSCAFLHQLFKFSKVKIHCEKRFRHNNADVKQEQYKPTELWQMPKGENLVRKGDSFIAFGHVIPKSWMQGAEL